MFHSLFNVSIFDMTSHYLLMFGITLRRREFPANARVHIHKSEKLIFVYFILRLSVSRPVLPELQTFLLDRQRIFTPSSDSEWLRCTQRAILPLS